MVRKAPHPSSTPERFTNRYNLSKKSFILRIDEQSFAALEKWAADDFRSINGQLEWIIDKALKENGRSPGAKKKPKEKKETK